MGVLEIACFSVAPGSNFSDPSTPEGKATKEGFAGLLAKSGATGARWGQEIEDPTHLWVFIDWNSVADHEAWTKHPEYKETMEKGGAYLKLEDGFLAKHATVSPFPVAVLDSAPVVEVFTVFFPADLSDADQAAVSAAFKKFGDGAIKSCREILGDSVGWGIENDFPLPWGSTEAAQGTGHKAHWAFIGWPSVETHHKFRESEAFKTGVVALKDMPRVVKMSAVHVKCVKA